MEYNRAKDNKWIIQKNISSGDLMDAFIESLYSQGNIIDSEWLKKKLYDKNIYKGRSIGGNANTMGVRLSQMCFYMFGYKKDGKFIPSPMTQMYINDGIDKQKLFLINLFSMQYPNPYSETPENFAIFIGRLIVKLLLDERIENKLYIDECIWFLPFIESINEKQYEELICDIVFFRTLSHKQKEMQFRSVDNYNEVFSNCTHEMNYYFIRIFESFGVINIINDPSHNEGLLFKFVHGNDSAVRNDAYYSRKKTSGFIKLDANIESDAGKLIEKFSPFEIPEKQSDAITKDDWIRDLYEFNPLKNINEIIDQNNNNSETIGSVEKMIFESKFGSRDGKTFEQSLKPIFELFRESRDVQLISGSGDTDLLCVMDNEKNEIYKINVDAKTARVSTQSINPIRIRNHIEKNGSNYCIIVSPRFSRGVKTDIREFPIVTVEAEVLANFCLKECLSSIDGFANYAVINSIIANGSLGSDISYALDNYIKTKYQIR